MTRNRLACALALFALCLAAACGDDDGDNGTIDAAATIDASGNTPTASFTMDPTCTTVDDSHVTFTSTSTDPQGADLTCSWTFASGDPLSSTDCIVEDVLFPNAAPYNVTLTVSNGTEQDTATDVIDRCP